MDQKGKYSILVAGDGIGGSKIVNCTVNGSSGHFSLDAYAEVEMGTFFLSEGKNTVTITPNWTWFDIDYIRIDDAQDEYTFDIAAAPVDDNATEAAKKCIHSCSTISEKRPFFSILRALKSKQIIKIAADYSSTDNNIDSWLIEKI